jgi:hypothetical protein
VKKFIFLLVLILVSLKIMAQENMVTISGGYAFANVADIDLNGTGWRVNGMYEFNPAGSKFSHGISFGYITVSATEGTEPDYIKYTVNSLPLYYAPKWLFGKEKIKGFVKGALGIQFASIKREGMSNLDDNDFGLYAGVGAGGMFFLKENIFLDVEYELAYVSNTWYKNKMMNTISGGIGFKF